MTTHAPTRHSRDLGVCTKLCRKFHASGNIRSQKVFQTDFKHRKSSRTWELINDTLTWVLVVVECLQTCRRLSVARGRCILSCLARITKLLCIEVVNIDCTKGSPLGLFCIINHTTKSALTSKSSERDKIGLSQKQEKTQVKRQTRIKITCMTS